MEHIKKAKSISVWIFILPFVAVTLLLGVVFGPTTPFVGDVYKNVADILQMLGEDALLALIAIIIIAIYLKK